MDVDVGRESYVGDVDVGDALLLTAGVTISVLYEGDISLWEPLTNLLYSGCLGGRLPPRDVSCWG